MTFKIKSTAVEINFSFAAVLMFLLLLFPNGNGVTCFLLCVLHETGHIIAMLFYKAPPRIIQLDYFGMKIVPSGKLLPVRSEAVIASAGITLNILFALIFCILNEKENAVLSLGLAVFNSLPVEILDGGKILLLITENRRLIKITGFLTAVILIIFGILIVIYSKRNFTALTVGIYILINMLTDSGRT